MLIVVFIQMFLGLVNHLDMTEGVYWVTRFDQDIDDEWRGRCREFEDYYTIVEEEGNSCLYASSEDSDCFIVKPIKVDIVEYPYLNWRWKSVDRPPNGDESDKSVCDVSASIAVVLNKSKIFPKSIKYSWSSTLPKEKLTESPYAIWPSKCFIRVMRSDEDPQDEWIYEKVNVLEDFKHFYKRKKFHTKKIYALVIMSDSDNTGGPSSAFYDDIYFSKS